MPIEPIAHPTVTQFNVFSNDVLASELRVNVADSATGRVVYYKDRQLGDNEIIEGVYENGNTPNSVRWVIHRPKRGWYIRLRAPSFPAGSFIPLNPSKSDLKRVGRLEFGCRTNVWLGSPSYTQHVGGAHTTESQMHSYPPSQSSSPSQQVPPSLSPPPAVPAPPQSQITQFILHPVPHASGNSFFTRAVAMLQHTSSFILIAAPKDSASEEDRDKPETQTLAASTVLGVELSQNQLLSFVENPRTSFATSSGTLSINEGLAAQLGVDVAFWVAIALTYWEFLCDRESYIAASSE